MPCENTVDARHWAHWRWPGEHRRVLDYLIPRRRRPLASRPSLGITRRPIKRIDRGAYHYLPQLRKGAPERHGCGRPPLSQVLAKS